MRNGLVQDVLEDREDREVQADKRRVWAARPDREDREDQDNREVPEVRMRNPFADNPQQVAAGSKLEEEEEACKSCAVVRRRGWYASAGS